MNYYNSNNINWGKVIIFFVFIAFILFACFYEIGGTEQAKTRNIGGSMEMYLEPNEKLVEITWKDSSLWCLTKPMTENDVAETYTFYEKDAYGLPEGTVYIYERKMNEEELKIYNTSKELSAYYYYYSNIDEAGNEIFIHYDEKTDMYILIKEFELNEYGELIAID